jgi:hypothetical protein
MKLFVHVESMLLGFDILLMSLLTIFGSAGEKALQGHSKFLGILHRGAKRDILTRVKKY